MTTTGWAGLIHGRTARADFRSRLLARPHDMPSVGWIRKHILPLTPHLDSDEPDKHFWGVFANEAHVVAGLVCWSSLLSETMYEELRKENSTQRPRLLYNFIGYCARRGQAPRRLPPMDPAAYRGLYEKLVGPRWIESFQERNWENPTETRYEEEPADLWLDARAPSRTLNSDPDFVLLHRKDDAVALWNDALIASHPVSLVIGMDKRQTVLKKDALFLDATLPGIETDERVARPRPIPPPLPPPPPEPPESPKKKLLPPWGGLPWLPRWRS